MKNHYYYAYIISKSQKFNFKFKNQA